MRTWEVGDRVVLRDGPVLSPGGAGSVVDVLPIAAHPVRVRWDVPQVSGEPGDHREPRATTLHWHSELAECAEAIERGAVER